jgi:hypothetical protein
MNYKKIEDICKTITRSIFDLQQDILEWDRYAVIADDTFLKENIKFAKEALDDIINVLEEYKASAFYVRDTETRRDNYIN